MRFLLVVILLLGGGCDSYPPAVPPVKTDLLVFYAKWCGPCHRAMSAIDQLESAGFKIERVDIDEKPDIAAKYSVFSVPTFIVFPFTNHQIRTQDIDTVRAKLKRQRN